MLNKDVKYVAKFQWVGAAYEETLTLLAELPRRGTWAAVKSAVLDENLLQKRSRSWKIDILSAVKHRYLSDHSSLPRADQVSKLVTSKIPRRSKIQVLYQYVCHSDPLIDRLITELVGPRLRNATEFRLTYPLYDDFLEHEARSHPEITCWSDSVRGKWRRSFYAFLRSSGFMAKAPSVEVRNAVIRPEAFTFLLHGMLDAGHSTTDCLQSHLWKRYFLDSTGVENMLLESQKRGWLQYRRLGSIVELAPSYSSLGGWLYDALE